MNRALSKVLAFVSSIAMILIWTGIIAVSLLWCYDAWRNRIGDIKERVSEVKHGFKSTKTYRTISGN